MWWVVISVVGIFVLYLFKRKKRLSAQAYNSSLHVKNLWEECPKSDFAFCDMVEVFMFIVVGKSFAYNPGKVKTAEFKIMLDDMAHDYLPECRERLLHLKNNISDDGFFTPNLTISDEKAQIVINAINSIE